MEELSRQVTLVAFVLALLGTFTGLFLGYRAVKNALHYTRRDEVAFGILVLNSLVAGAALGFLYFSSILLISIFHPNFPLSTERFLGSCAISLMLLVGVTIAGTWLQSWLIAKVHS
jgi:hypothetical protein